MASLTYDNRQFRLNGSPFHIFSGAIHYFRVVPDYWRDRLAKAKACGLNTIETYVPWNWHEEQRGVFKADGILDLRKFIGVAADLDLKVILRPGPYICSEWDFGGLPAWLLADPDMKVRTNYPGYKDAAEKYLKWILGLVIDLQYSKGGPIIAVQVENEFGSYSDDVDHLHFIKTVMEDAGITELLVTSDNPWGSNPALYIPGVVPTANFQTVEEGKVVVDIIEKTDPSVPLMAMEFWAGWFDHWGSKHHVRSVDILEDSFRFLLDKQASVNFYMFHGGTNFGFMSGANLTDAIYKPDVTSYDYDAPISEDGRLTEKYFKIHEMIKTFLSKTYGKNLDDVDKDLRILKRIDKRREIVMEEYLPWSAMIDHVKKVTSCVTPRTMETFTFANGETQAHGYIVYRRAVTISESSELVLPPYVKDRATVLVDAKVVAAFDINCDTCSVVLEPPKSGTGAGTTTSCVTLDIVVENLGRVNYTEKANPDVLNSQWKGMKGEVTLGGNPINDWTVIALDFTNAYLSDVTKSDAWKEIAGSCDGNQPGVNPVGPSTSTTTTCKSPALYRGRFDVIGKPADCFVKLEGFTKGIVLVNGFNLGRYWSIGPQRTLYLPAPILKEGQNVVLVFEEQRPAKTISLELEPQLM